MYSGWEILIADYANNVGKPSWEFYQLVFWRGFPSSLNVFMYSCMVEEIPEGAYLINEQAEC